MNSMEYIRRKYRVPAKRGMRVKFTKRSLRGLMGTITGARNEDIRIRVDGDKHSACYPPTEGFEYQPWCTTKPV